MLHFNHFARQIQTSIAFVLSRSLALCFIFIEIDAYSRTLFSRRDGRIYVAQAGEDHESRGGKFTTLTPFCYRRQACFLLFKQRDKSISTAQILPDDRRPFLQRLSVDK